MTILDDMLARVNGARDQLRKNGDFEQSMVMAFQMQGATLQAIEQQLAQSGTDPTKLAALQDAIGALAADTIAQGQKWADDVKANTGVGENSGSTDAGDAGSGQAGDGSTTGNTGTSDTGGGAADTTSQTGVDTSGGAKTGDGSQANAAAVDANGKPIPDPNAPKP